MSDSSRSSRLAVNKIFGESRPDASADERDANASEGDAERDRWLQENVPPHHG